ncbi:hypothetical protein O9993_05600 [Vibrio lentus]|nr:hypothetical protein [Vibrio lentus]
MVFGSLTPVSLSVAVYVVVSIMTRKSSKSAWSERVAAVIVELSSCLRSHHQPNW